MLRILEDVTVGSKLCPEQANNSNIKAAEGFWEKTDKLSKSITFTGFPKTAQKIYIALKTRANANITSGQVSDLTMHIQANPKEDVVMDTVGITIVALALFFTSAASVILCNCSRRMAEEELWNPILPDGA